MSDGSLRSLSPDLKAQDDGSADFAAETAADWIARAWFRRTETEGGNGGEDMLHLCAAARSHISADQWKQMGVATPDSAESDQREREQ